MFNAEEISMLSAFNTFSRKTAVQDILSRLPYMENDELKSMASEILRKLDRMSDDEFFSYDYTPQEDEDE
ncbi:MAG: hypothetical protein IKG00_02865 [Lachnospiraceae bacterium]|jgi:signal transduction histidine kinase|nr:hypothetical protein [Lachnospiraceae bacterium]